VGNSCRQQLNRVGAQLVPVNTMKACGNGGITPLILYSENNDFLQHFKGFIRKHLCCFTLIKVLVHCKRRVARVGEEEMHTYFSWENQLTASYI